MKLKIISLCLVLLCSTFLSSVTVGGTLEFTDVDQNNEYYNAIGFIADNGIVSGYQDGSYQPEKVLNRAELLKIVVEAVYEDEFEEYKNSKCFTDVPSEEWYTQYVCFAKDKEFVVGYEGNVFKPEEPISLVEGVKIAMEVFEYNYSKTYPWYKGFIEEAAKENFIPLDFISFDQDMNRGQMADLITRILKSENNTLDEYLGDTVDYVVTYDTLKNNINVAMETVPDNNSGDESPETVEVDTAPVGEIVDNNDDNADDSGEIDNIEEINMNVFIDSIQVNAGEAINIDITITDKEGNPLNDRIISVNATAPIDFFGSLYVQEAETGVYETTFLSTLAGDFSLAISDEESKTEVVKTISVKPGYFDHVEVIDVVYPHENEDHDKAVIKVVGKDEYENTLPYSSVNNNLGAISNLGSVSVSHDDGGIFTIEVAADDWGIDYISIIDNNSSTIVYDEGIEIKFLPIQLGIDGGMNLSDGQIAVPINVYFPEDYGKLGSYEFDLYYDNSVLDYIDVEDPIISDNFAIPSVEVNEELGLIHLSQINSDPNATATEDISIGAVLFNVTTAGGSTIYVADAVVSDTSGSVIEYASKFADVVGGVIDAVGGAAGDAIDYVGGEMGGAVDGAFRWWYNIKKTVDVCIDAFVFPGNGVNAAAISADITMANFIFGKIAQSCNCGVYLNFKLNSTTNLTVAQWNGVDANGDGDLDLSPTELNGIVNNHPATGNCIPVYYPPDINGANIGVSWEGTSEGIAIDHSLDADNRTLAHELAHQISDGGVVDPNNPPASATQGADTAGNLMNYANTGDNLTKNQCKLIESNLP